MDIAKLSAAKLEALMAKRDAEHSKVCSALIDAGFGMERHSETAARAKATGDALAIRSVETSDACHEVWSEMQARKTYHGSLKPIKRSTWA